MTRWFKTVDDACVYMENSFYVCQLIKVNDGWIVIEER